MKPWTEYGGFKRPSGRAQQGVLFRAGPQELGMPPEHQYPRGYTPERLRAVSTAIPERSVGVATAVGATPFTIDAKEAWFRGTKEEEGGRRWNRSIPDVSATRNEITRKRIIDTVARSGMSAEDLAAMPAFEVTARQAGQQPGGRSWLGSYVAPAHMSGTEPTPSALEPIAEANAHRHELATRQGRVNLYGSGEGTLMHELGHHVSAQRGLEHSAYETTQQRGREEAFADDYMMTHHVPRRGQSPLPNESAYESKDAWKPLAVWPGEGWQGHHEYLRTRQTRPPKPEPEPSWEPQTHQQHLFGRPVDVRFTDTEKDYGQWGYRTHEDQPMQTVGLPPPPRAQRMRGGHPFTAEDIGEPEAWNRDELSPQTKQTLTQQWGRNATMGMGLRSAMQRWGKEHPELGWQT